MRVTSPNEVALRRMSHLLRVQEARAAQLRADDEMQQAVASARAGGCDAVEIQASVRLIERAARA